MIVRSRNNYTTYFHVRSIYLAGLKYDYVSVSMGAFDPLIIIYRIMGKKCLRLWIGTDVLKTLRFWDYRIRAKLISLFCDNFAVAPWLCEELKMAGIESNYLELYADTDLLS